MQELINVATNAGVKMLSSKRIAERTGKEHSNVLRDIRNMILELEKEDSKMNPGEYQLVIAQNGMTGEMLLNERLSICLASGYSISLRIAIIDDWAEMKKQTQQPKELSRIEILTMALETERKNVELEAKIALDAPKVEFAEQLLSTTNAIDFATSAKAMQLPFGRNTLFEHCRNLKILMASNQPYQNFIDLGYFVVLESSFSHPKSGDRIMTTKTLITAKGQVFIIKKLKENSFI